MVQLAQQLEELEIGVDSDVAAQAPTGKQAFIEALDPAKNNDVAGQASAAISDMEVVQAVTNPIPVVQAVQSEIKQGMPIPSIEVEAARTTHGADNTEQQERQKELEQEHKKEHGKGRNHGQGKDPRSRQINGQGSDGRRAKGQALARGDLDALPPSARSGRKLSKRTPRARPSNTFSDTGNDFSLRKQHPHALKFRQQRARSEAVLMDAAVGKIGNGSTGWATDATACKAQGNAVLGLRLFLGRIGDDPVDGDLLSITTGEAADIFGTV